MNISERLMVWYRDYARDLPWRHTRDPYRIWLSEVILQQTRVVQGIAYYYRITEAFPDVISLASASEDEVLKLWQGLGYYSRARNMHEAARWIVRENGGVFPSTYEGIMQMKGVGEYTAAAIASIAYDLPYPVLDGNVYRVLTRLFGIEDAIDSSIGRKKCREVASQLMPESDYGIYNQAIMEFGALHCIPKNPDCGVCIFREDCFARRNGKVSDLPVKKSKTAVKTLYVYHIIMISGGRTFIRKQTESGIWKGLYQFPFFESERELSLQELMNHSLCEELHSGQNTEFEIISGSHHLLSHRRLIPIYVIIPQSGELKAANVDYLIVGISELHKFPVSKMMERFLAGNYKKLLHP